MDRFVQQQQINLQDTITIIIKSETQMKLFLVQDTALIS